MEIEVHHLTRVEGHGDLIAKVGDGRPLEARFDVVEPNRFFEAILRGRNAEEVVHIASRICGICAVSHSCAALLATEKALGLEISPQTFLLRRLVMNAEVMSSHALHVLFLAAPDFVGLPSVMPLVKENPELVRRAFRIKRTGYDLGEAVLGRHTHPVTAAPGGYTAVPQAEALARMRDRLVALRADLEAAADLYRSFTIPEFTRETEYVCLRRPDCYSFYDGDIISTDGGRIATEDYLENLHEYVVLGSNAKQAKWHRDSYLVGALARVNNNADQLHPAAAETMEALGLSVPCHNPFMNTVAQLTEMIHCNEDSIALIEALLARGIEEEWEPEIPRRAGRGVGVVEAPRGLLIHDYTYGDDGRCVEANCIIPTNQNMGNLNADLPQFLAQVAGGPEPEVRQQLEMLVRAYDPCISCSVH
jgi:sulfhydrogenase subunit alpha